ncbi:MAG: hypothetical protein A2X79_07825 [Desulfuromonadaceae bacterium GWB2_53_15]|nr:MAG: hypothetical protein A2X83_13160 [Desulfuromonadales bacterium GWD2_54_10]OHB31671.1 MAG: hypothetical protein A2X79_07825 [Desulfuromonadaceae bacterium GWB2_53_15]
MNSTFLCCIFLLLSAPVLRAENEIQIGKFSSGDLTGWKDQTIFNTKKTIYSFVQDNGKTVLMAKSNNSASGLVYKLNLDPKTYQTITWSWKIEHTVKKGNEKIKVGHDFAARLYVVFPRGFFSRTRAIEYVWGNVLHRGDTLRSPYSKNADMIVLDAGEELAGSWTFHQRNIYEDYRNSFGEDPPKIGAIAIMTDSDNTHESAVGYYGDIGILPAPQEKEQKNKEQLQKELKNKEQPKSNGLPLPPAAAPLPVQIH